jgi:acetoin utilization protein AcuB
VTLADIMTRDPFVIDPRASVGEAFHEMTTRGIRHLPVVERARLIGIVTDRDLRAYAASPEVNVGWIMTAKPQVGRSSENVREVARRMAESRIGSLPVVDDDGVLVGIVTTVDVMQALSRLPEPPVA